MFELRYGIQFSSVLYKAVKYSRWYVQFKILVTISKIVSCINWPLQHGHPKNNLIALRILKQRKCFCPERVAIGRLDRVRRYSFERNKF